MGIRDLECSPESLRRIETWGKRENRPPASEGKGALNRIEQTLKNCRRCDLWHGRKTIVFGEGNPEARIVFVGEGPGFDEDREGRPFVGPAGRLLTKIINAMGLVREEVYICNVVKCRPPENRAPEPEEIRTCTPFLRSQLEAVRPEFICTLGAVAAQCLLGTDRPVSELRGRFHDYGGVPLIPTFHPAHLLRHPEKKRDVWEDIKKLMKAAGLPIDNVKK